MPSNWQVLLSGPSDVDIPLTAPRAVASSWLDDPRQQPADTHTVSSHTAPTRPWAITPPRDNHHGTTRMDIRLLDDRLTPRIQALRPGTPVRLGRHHYQITETRQNTACSWNNLHDWAGQRAWTITFQSPATFRRGTRTSPWPDPLTIIRGLTARWHGIHPDTTPKTPDASGLWISDLNLQSIALRFERTIVSAVTGTLHLRCDGTNPDTAATHTLLTFATYAGIGSHTTAGFGTITLETETPT